MIALHVDHGLRKTAVTWLSNELQSAVVMSNRPITLEEAREWTIGIARENDARLLIVEASGLGTVLIDMLVEAVPEGVLVIANHAGTKSPWKGE